MVLGLKFMAIHFTGYENLFNVHKAALLVITG